MIEMILMTATIEGETCEAAIPCDKTVRRISDGKMKEVVVIEGEEFDFAELMQAEVIRQNGAEADVAIEEISFQAGRVRAVVDLSLIDEDTRKSWKKSSDQRVFLAFDEDEEEDVKPAPKAPEKASKGDTKNG